MASLYGLCSTCESSEVRCNVNPRLTFEPGNLSYSHWVRSPVSLSVVASGGLMLTDTITNSSQTLLSQTPETSVRTRTVSSCVRSGSLPAPNIAGKLRTESARPSLQCGSSRCCRHLSARSLFPALPRISQPLPPHFSRVVPHPNHHLDHFRSTCTHHSLTNVCLHIITICIVVIISIIIITITMICSSDSLACLPTLRY
jgi:hypothetical protein